MVARRDGEDPNPRPESAIYLFFNTSALPLLVACGTISSSTTRKRVQRYTVLIRLLSTQNVSVMRGHSLIHHGNNLPEMSPAVGNV